MMRQTLLRLFISTQTGASILATASVKIAHEWTDTCETTHVECCEYYAWY